MKIFVNLFQLIFDFDNGEHGRDKDKILFERWLKIEAVLIKLLLNAKISDVNDLADLKLLSKLSPGNHSYYVNFSFNRK